MHGFDGLVGAAERGRLDELGEELPAEQPVVGRLLVTAFETGDGPMGRWVAVQVEAVEEIAPELFQVQRFVPAIRIEHGPIKNCYFTGASMSVHDGAAPETSGVAA
jgi:hypothetical protein